MLRQKTSYQEKSPGKTSEEQVPSQTVPSNTHDEQTSFETRKAARTKLRLALAFLLLGVLVAASTLLPARIANKLDSLLLSKVEVQALTPDTEAPPIATPLIDRLKLLAAPPHSELIYHRLQTGEYLDEKTALEALDRELEELRSRKLYPADEVVKGSARASTRSSEPSLYLLPARPDINGIIWEIRLVSEQFTSVFYLDDESGKVLSYSLKCYGPLEGVFTEQSGELWTTYLGIAADALEVVEEAGEPLHPREEGESNTPPVSLEKPTSADNVVSATDFEKHFRFTLKTKTSALEFFCEQYTDYDDERATILSLRVVTLDREISPDIPFGKFPES
jgi:hypothetical protein